MPERGICRRREIGQGREKLSCCSRHRISDHTFQVECKSMTDDFDTVRFACLRRTNKNYRSIVAFQTIQQRTAFINEHLGRRLLHAIQNTFHLQGECRVRCNIKCEVAEVGDRVAKNLSCRVNTLQILFCI